MRSFSSPSSRAPLRAVVFDWYATLAAPLPDGWWNQVSLLVAGAGGEPDAASVLSWQQMPTEHLVRSTSAEEYDAWVAERFRAFVRDCGVPLKRVDPLVAASERMRRTEVVPALVGAAEVIARLRRGGLRVGLCSNWDWDLDRHLRANGLDDAFDTVVCSAIAGYRKPHRAIFDLVLERLDLEPESVIFVGDDLDCDVVGAASVGMTPVHASWAYPCATSHPAEVSCCSSFDELLALPAIAPLVGPASPSR